MWLSDLALPSDRIYQDEKIDRAAAVRIFVLQLLLAFLKKGALSINFHPKEKIPMIQ